jgi:hypothetical protein
MGRIVYPAQHIGLTPDVASLKYKTGEAILAGSLLVFDGSGELTVCGADPAIIDAVSLEPAGSKPGWDAANSSQVVVVTGRVQEVSVARANRTTVFSSRLEDGSGNILTPAQTNVDEEYGITKDAAGEWYVNTAKTAADARVRIIDFDATHKVVFWKFLEANIPSN